MTGWNSSERSFPTVIWAMTFFRAVFFSSEFREFRAS
jgi:hypothetical protein